MEKRIVSVWTVIVSTFDRLRRHAAALTMLALEQFERRHEFQRAVHAEATKNLHEGMILGASKHCLR